MASTRPAPIEPRPVGSGSKTAQFRYLTSGQSAPTYIAPGPIQLNLHIDGRRFATATVPHLFGPPSVHHGTTSWDPTSTALGPGAVTDSVEDVPTVAHYEPLNFSGASDLQAQARELERALYGVTRRKKQ